jgi:uncharacterized repeat protein (TIGR01451 family)
MKRWKMWTSLAAGLLSVGGPGTYLGWRHFASKSAEEVLAKLEEPAAEKASQTPTPIPLPDENQPLAFNPIARASFNAPNEQRVVRANDDQPAPPPRPMGSFKMGDAPAPIASADSPPNEAPPSRPPSDRWGQPGTSSFAPAPLAANNPEVVAGESERTSIPPASPSAIGSFNLNRTESAAGNVADVTENTEAPPAGEPPTQPNSLQPPPTSFADEKESAPVSTPSTFAPQSRFETPIAAEPAELEPVPTRPRANARTKPEAADQFSSQAPPSAIDRTPPGSPAIRPLAEARVTTTLTSDAPGERKLEGAQTPMLGLEKTAPDEIQVGKPAKFTIKVKNMGQTAALGVVVSDRVPQGTQFIESAPPTTPARDGALAWELGTMQPGEESIISLELMPENEGEIGSIAQVTFHAQAGVRTVSTRPLITLEHSGPAKVLIGEDVPFHITVSNPGSGVATGVVIEVDVPDQLAHEGGREIMSDRFDLRPNETVTRDLVMKAVQPGIVENIVRATGDANLATEHRTKLEVVAPKLQVAVSGPTRRFLQRQVTYQIAVSNPGTAAAKDVALVAFLPQGLKFVGTEKKGEYDQQKHAVYWSLEELPAGESGTVQLSAIPTDAGEQKLHIETTAALDLIANIDHTTIVEALTELVFTVADENDPIEVGAETSYEIRITNNGSKMATNVQLLAVLPPDLAALKSDGPSKAQTKGQQIVFEPISELAPREEAVYRIVVQGKRAGDHLIRVQVVSDEFSTPVTKEESTKVYADE